MCLAVGRQKNFQLNWSYETVTNVFQSQEQHVSYTIYGHYRHFNHQICQEYSSEQQILKWHEGYCISTKCDIYPRHMCCNFCYQLAHFQSAIPFFLKDAELANSPHYFSLTTLRIVPILQLYIYNFLSLLQSVWHHWQLYKNDVTCPLAGSLAIKSALSSNACCLEFNKLLGIC